MDITWILSGVLGVLVIYVVYYLYNKKNYWEERGVTLIKSTILRTIKLLFLSNKTFLDYTIWLYKTYGHERFVGYNLGKTNVLLVHDPELIQNILIKDFSYFEDRSLPLEDDGELGNLGLASLTGKRWRLLRHKLTPTFTSGKMKTMFSQIKGCSDEFVLYLENKEGVDLETRDFMFKFMMNVIAKTAFSIEANAFDNPDNNEFVKHSRGFFNPSRLLQIKFMILTFMPKLKSIFKLRIADAKANDFFLHLAKDLIKQRVESGKRRNDFLQLMLDQREKELSIVENAVSDKNQTSNNVHEEGELFDYLKDVKFDKDSIIFTDECIAAQTFLFISGGSETTSATVSFVLHELAVNQDIQRKAQAEIDSILSTQEFDYEAVKKMKYLEQVINEVLRLRSPGAVIARMCVQDYKIPRSNVVLEKGTLVQIPAIALQQDSQYFPEPEKFNPDHFEDMDSIPKGVFLPFGGGPRMCIAMRLAMLEMKVFLATVLSTFNVVHSEKTPLPLIMDKKSFLQHVKGGLWVKFEKR